MSPELKGRIVTAAFIGGVMDYSNLLANSTQGFVVKTVASSTDIQSENDCIFLQYSGYEYAKRGAPLWLLRQVQANRSQIKTLGVFFHELYAFRAAPWRSAFWLSPIQRYIVRRLAEQSDFWITSSESNAQWLRRFAADKPHAVLPVFSNVGEMPVYSADRTPKVIVFGGSALRLAAYRAAGDALFAWAKRWGLTIHDIGSAINDPIVANRLISEGAIVHGRLSETEISRLLADAIFGVVVYQMESVAKSGVFAAYCAHGICPVVISEKYPTSDGLRENQHYLGGIPDTDYTSSTIVADIGRAAWNWYQPHRIARHVAALNNFLDELGNVS